MLHRILRSPSNRYQIEVVLDATKAVAAVPSKGLSDRITYGFAQPHLGIIITYPFQEQQRTQTSDCRQGYCQRRWDSG